MKKRILSLAREEDAKDISILIFTAFNEKFIALLDQKAIAIANFYYKFLKTNLKKLKHHNCIIIKKDSTVLGMFLVNGSKIQNIFSHVSYQAVIDFILEVGLVRFIRFMVGMFIIGLHPIPKKYMYINAVAVNKNFRGRGIGQNLMKVATKVGKSRGFEGEMLYVGCDNRKAVKLYLKQNYKITKKFESVLFSKFHNYYGFFEMKKKYK
ncbi:MAG: GNAT family N-acetyltransferase [Candidatus Hodarchaeales archaeon]|jgi:ribosomal protein S18 acetylase RimI-like enzyme